MAQRKRNTRTFILLIVSVISLTFGQALAQQGPVAFMFGDDQKRGEEIALSFATTEMAPTATAAFPSKIYLTGGDLERAFDTPRFRADAAIVPTNPALDITASSPATQRVLIDRVRKQSAVMRDLQEQIAAHRKQSPAAADWG